MLRVISICLLLLPVVICAQVATIIASSGAPTWALDARSGPPDPKNPSLLRVTMDSGNLGLGKEERWSAFRFHISQAISMDGIEINFLEKAGSIPTTYGYIIYSDNGNKPGSVLTTGVGVYALLVASSSSKTCANTFIVDKVATVPVLPPLDLAPGNYWAAVYGVDGNISQFVGAPGGSSGNNAWRKTGIGSAYTSFETKSFVLPGWEADLRAGYDAMGSSAPYNYSGWTENEQQGRDLYHIAYCIVDRSGDNATVVKGTINVQGWQGDVPQFYFQDDQTRLQAFDIYFVDPANGTPVMIETVNVDSAGRFTTRSLENGTYNVIVYPRHWYIGRFDCTDGTTTYTQPVYTAMGHGFIPVQKNGVTLSGGTTDIGTLTLIGGDANLNSQIDVGDINRIFLSYTSTIFGACPPNWADYVVSYDADADGNIGIYDLNAMFIGFFSSGPSR